MAAVRSLFDSGDETSGDSSGIATFQCSAARFIWIDDGARRCNLLGCRRSGNEYLLLSAIERERENGNSRESLGER